MIRYQYVERLVLAMSNFHERHNHHGPTVAVLAVKLADAAGLPAHEIDMVEVGANLHDIGKLMISRDLLNAPRKLEEHEMVIVRTHAGIGWSFVEQAAFDPIVCDVVRHHHERFGGNGYPDGLQFDQIPIGARIVAICDVYAALIAPRSYRDAYSPPFAKSFVQAGKGHEFDPRLVDLFFERVVTDAE